MADRVRQQWTGSGTGTMTLGAAVPGFQAFPASFNGKPISYLVQHTGDGIIEVELGKGIYTHSTTSLTRSDVRFSTNSNALVEFSGGTKHVSFVPLFEDLVQVDGLLFDLIKDSSDLDKIWGRDSEGAPVERAAGAGVTVSDDEVSVDFGTTSTTVAAGNRGLPTGGTTGQVLKKLSGTNFHAGWADESGGGGGGSSYNHVTDTADYSSTPFQVGTGGALVNEERRFTNTTGTQKINFPAGIAEDSFGALDVGAGVTAQIIGAATVTIDGVLDRGGAGSPLSLPGRFAWRATALNVIEFSPSSEGTQDVWQDVDFHGNDLQGIGALAGCTVTGPILLGTGGSISDAGPVSASGSLTKATHGGRAVLTSGNVTIPNSSGDVGMGGIIILGGAHTISFNSTTTATLATGDVFTYYVQSTTVLRRSLQTAASQPAMS